MIAVRCRCSSPRPALKERSAAFRPFLPLSGVLRFGQHDQRTRQFVGGERIGPGGDDQFAELLHLTVLQFFDLVFQHFQFGVKVTWLAHHVLHLR